MRSLRRGAEGNPHDPSVSTNRLHLLRRGGRVADHRTPLPKMLLRPQLHRSVYRNADRDGGNGNPVHSVRRTYVLGSNNERLPRFNSISMDQEHHRERMSRSSEAEMSHDS